jgi:hypothetical protein
MDWRAKIEDETENAPKESNDGEPSGNKRHREINDDEDGPHCCRPTMDEIEKLLTCPISHDIMNDPVTLDKSGHVFDRESLCKSLLKKPTKCPLTNTDYGEKLHYADCISIRKLLTMFMGEKGYQRFDDSIFRKEYEAISIHRPVEPDASTLFAFGEHYRRADGVEQDYIWARLFYDLATGWGHADAQCQLGVLYDIGKGVDQDYDKAKYYYEQAAVKGHAVAQFNLDTQQIQFKGVTLHLSARIIVPSRVSAEIE